MVTSAARAPAGLAMLVARHAPCCAGALSPLGDGPASGRYVAYLGGWALWADVRGLLVDHVVAPHHLALARGLRAPTPTFISEVRRLGSAELPGTSLAALGRAARKRNMLPPARTLAAAFLIVVYGDPVMRLRETMSTAATREAVLGAAFDLTSADASRAQVVHAFCALAARAITGAACPVVPAALTPS